MPKRKISTGQAHPQQDCSDGAKMLIDQMKQYPEEFRGFGGKFSGMLDTAQEVQRGAARNMSKRDAEAVVAAAQTHLFEVWLAEDVLTSIMQPKPEVEKPWGTTTGRSSGKSVLGQGIQLSVNPYITASNITTSQYDAAYQTELTRYKMELEKQRQEDFKRREHEHAMRNTKPYKPFL